MSASKRRMAVCEWQRARVVAGAGGWDALRVSSGVKGVWVFGDIPVLNSRALIGPAWASPLAQDSTTDSLSASWGPLAPCAIATAEGEEWADACAPAGRAAGQACVCVQGCRQAVGIRVARQWARIPTQPARQPHHACIGGSGHH